MPVILACLPVMVLHTLSVSLVSYRLIRRVSRQNQLLDELRRIDALTGLYDRGHWQEQAEATLRRHHATDRYEDRALNPWYSKGTSTPSPIGLDRLPEAR